MDTALKTTRVEDLLTHADWLRRLAGRLVHPGEIDDLLQETWQAAVRSPPRGAPEEARPWLAKVLRNRWRNRWRTRMRAERVAAAPAPAEAPTPDELLDRARTERRLADIVLTLEEPYRSTILLRYYEGKSAAEIARALSIPAGTVRWRLSEALERLRDRLDGTHGGKRERWRALLLPIAAHLPAIAPRATVAGSSLLAGKKAPALLSLLAVGAMLVVGAVFLLRPSEAPDGPVGLAVELRADGDRPRIGYLVAGQTPAAGSAGVEGIVLDPRGLPVAGAQVVLAGTGKTADWQPVRTLRRLSGADGEFSFLEVEPGQYTATATDERWAGGFSSPFLLAPGGRHRITLRLTNGGYPIEGQILDEGGGPIPGARVRAELGYPWEQLGPSRRFETVADQEGRYRLRLEPREYAIRATVQGYARGEITAALDRPLRRDLRLRPAARVSGLIVDAISRQPVPDAVVRLTAELRSDGNSREGRSDAEGKFLFADVEAGSYQLFAWCCKQEPP